MTVNDLDKRLRELSERAGDECKAIRLLLNRNKKDLSDLTTTDKSNIVAAINEINSAQSTDLDVEFNSSSSLTITSSSGSNAVIEAATQILAGLLSATDKIKLDDIQVGATSNSSDSFLLNRDNHSGTQTSDTISDFDSSVDARVLVLIDDSTASNSSTYSSNKINSFFDSTSPISGYNKANWDNAFGWGDHSIEGYIKVETDPVFSASPSSSVTLPDIIDWNRAFSWGDHAEEGYIKVETDPVFSASEAFNITGLDILNWDTAFGWGDHSTEGYLTSFTESDPTVPSHVKSITSAQVSEWSTSYDDDIISLAVTGTNTKTLTLTQRDGSTLFTQWSDLDTPPDGDEYIDALSFVSATGVLTAGRTGSLPDITTSLDGRYSLLGHTHVAADITDLASFLGFDARYYTELEVDNLLSGYVNTAGYNNLDWDTAFGWGDHAVEGYLTSFSESDPTVPPFVKAITNQQINEWDEAFDWGDHALGGYVLKTGDTMTGNLNMDATTDSRFINIGSNRTGDGSSYVDLIGDTTYTEFGLRVGRESAGANAQSNILHRGTGALLFAAQDGGNIDFGTSSTVKMRLQDDGNIYAPSLTDAIIDAASDFSMVTKGWVENYQGFDSRYVSKSGDTISGVLFIDGGSNGLRVQGTGVGNANNSIISVLDSNRDRQGYFGFPSSSNEHLYLYSDVSQKQFRMQSDGLLYYNGPAEFVGGINMTGISNEAIGLQVGIGRSGNGNSFLDLVGDSTYTDYGARFIRSSGNNGDTQILHRGTGQLELRAIENDGEIAFTVGSAQRMKINSSFIEFNRNTRHSDGNALRLLDTADRVEAVINMRTNGGDAVHKYLIPNGSGTKRYAEGWWHGSNYNYIVTTFAGWNFGGSVQATSFPTSSDKRLKKDIQEISKNKFEVDFKQYRFKEGEDNLRYGVIAQEIEKDYPELVTENEEGFKAVDYTSLLCAKVSEQEKRIKRLEKLVEQLLKDK